MTKADLDGVGAVDRVLEGGRVVVEHVQLQQARVALQCLEDRFVHRRIPLARNACPDTQLVRMASSIAGTRVGTHDQRGRRC